MNHRFTTHLTALAAVALLLFGASQALAGGTDSGTVISNFATLEYAVGGTDQTEIPSASIDFTVDTKIRPLVTQAGGSLTLTPNRTGSEQHWMKFTVKNEGNSTQNLRLSYETDDGDLTTALSGVIVVEEKGTTAGYTIDEDGTTDLNNTALSFTKDETRTFYVVAPDTAANLANGQAAVYHLLATAWDTTGAGGSKVEEDESDTEDSADNVYADSATSGSYAADIEFDGQHSDSQTFTVAMANLSVTKEQSVLDDNFGGTFYVPGAIVQYKVTIANAAGAAAATLATIGDTLNANLTLVGNLDSSGKNIKAYTTGSSRSIDTLGNADYFAGTLTGQALSVAMTTVLPVEGSYDAGELKGGESVVLIFNVIIN